MRLREILPIAGLMVGTLLVGCVKDNRTICNNIGLEIAHSEMKRMPNPLNLDFQTLPKWDYSASVELLGLMTIANDNRDKELRKYVYQWTDTMVSSEGVIRGYKPTKHNIDHLCPGKLLLKQYRETKEAKYMKAAESLMEQLKTHPRTTEGGLWHKEVYPHQMWLDGLYMGAPFVAEYGALNKIDVAEDMVRQYLIVARHTYDSDTKLYRHGWDEKKEQFWADSITGRSQHAWGRANGWFMMGMVDVLDYIPEGTVGRDSVLMILNNLVEAIQEYRDPETRMWFQVLDSPCREGNYVESSCSAMFIYSMLKAVRKGYIPEKYEEIAQQDLMDYIKTFVSNESDGMYSITQCCAVAGLGGKDMRNGTYDYYLSEQVRDNDPKAIGPFLMACHEMNLRK